MTPASDSSRPISSKRSSSFSSLRRMESFMAADYSGLDRLRTYCRSRSSVKSRVRSRASAESASSAAWRSAWVGAVQQPVGEGVGEIIDDFVGGFARGQHAPRLLHGLLRECHPLAGAVHGWPGPASCARDSARNRATSSSMSSRAPPAATSRCWTVLVDQLLQVVDGEQVHVFQLGHRRLDVARHGHDPP